MATAQTTPVYQPHVVIVQFAAGTGIAGGAAQTGLQTFDRMAVPYSVHRIERVFPFLDNVMPTPETARNLDALRRTYYVQYRANDGPKNVANTLGAARGVVYAEPVIINRVHGTEALYPTEPNDALYSRQTYLSRLRLTEAWDEVKGEDGTPPVVIAIVDGGGEWRHEDLLANVWANPGEVANNGLDDDANGFIDDVHGVNLANEDPTNNDPAGLAQTPGSALHGTMVAGVASAVTDNSTGVAGAAWNAELMHVNAGCSQDDGAICFGYEGILYAAANGADIINSSWGGVGESGTVTNTINQALELATDMGALVVASAGNASSSNDLFPVYPAVHPRVLSVGATAKDSRRKSSSSNFGRLVNVFAPGEDILSTAPGAGYTSSAGASFSAPLVSGIAALVKTKFPSIRADALREQVRLAAENMDAQNPGLAGQLGRGYVNAIAAVQEPALPAVRVKRWAWHDSDGNGQIGSGDSVTVKVVIVNHLTNAQKLTIGLRAAEPYPFIEMTVPNVEVGTLDRGDSTEATFQFSVAPSAPQNRRVQLYTRIQVEAHVDESDMLSFGINLDNDNVHGALSALYTATDGDNWHSNDGWDISRVPTSEELAQWFGVYLPNGFLLGLYLNDNNLSGVVPADLGKLSELRELDLNSNLLSGSIPAELSSLSQLQTLNLQNNTLTGAIPSELGSLSELRQLLLNENNILGEVPSELGNLSELRQLRLNDNRFYSKVPPELGNLVQLKRLDLHSNSLDGPLPPELGNLAQLEWLDLHNNYFDGPLPPELGNLAQLKRLDLYNNYFDGPLPPELGNLAQLEQLILTQNQSTGPIPRELGNLAQLRVLNLEWNRLYGPIPSELGNLAQLRVLNLKNNRLSGPIRSELGNLAQLQRLNLESNWFYGPIPSELGNLAQLRVLDLKNNQLRGPTPSELGNLAQLRVLDLEDNFLSGTLPRSFLQLRLTRLNFDGQDLCAPNDDAFQAWLNRIHDVSGPTCNQLIFIGTVQDQNYSLGDAIADLVLPAATGGTSPYTYALTPGLPAFLVFDANTRTVSGTPEALAPATQYTYSVMDSAGQATSLTFSIQTGTNGFSGIAADQTFQRAQAIVPLVLPAANQGTAPIDYTLTPALPEGLTFDNASRTISGTPKTVMAATPYVFTATDLNGSRDSLTFGIKVYSPVGAEPESLPVAFTLRGNYPNPFHQATHILFDLPWHGNVSVDVRDVLGRRVLELPYQAMAAGWERSIRLDGAALPSGHFVYRVYVQSPAGNEVHAGMFVHLH